MPLKPAPASVDPEQAAHDAALASLKANEIVRLARIEGKLGLPTGYYQTLEKEGSDWEFAIKLVVLLEAALGAVLAARLQNPAVLRHCDRLNLGGQTGKLELAKDLGVLEEAERKAFSALVEIRNGFAHRVANVRRNLEDYAKAQDMQTLRRLGLAMMMVPRDREAEADFLFTPRQFPVAMRYVMWTSGSMLIDALATQDAHAEAEAARLQWLRPADGTNPIATLADLYTYGQPKPEAN